MKSAPPIQLELRTSRMLQGGLIAIAAAAFAALLGCALADGLKLALLVVWVIYAVLVWRQLVAVDGVRLILLPDRRWRILLAAVGPGSTIDIEADLLHSAIIGPLIALELRDADGWRRRFALCQDSASPDSLRQLRVWLRVGVGRSLAQQA